MNAFPNESSLSPAPRSPTIPDGMQQQMMNTPNLAGGGLQHVSNDDDGDLGKFSGDTNLSGTDAGILDEKIRAEDKIPEAKMKGQHNPAGDKATKKTNKVRKKWKKPKDKPNRPLSAYNLFFKAERAAMLGDDAKAHDQDKGQKRIHRKTHGKISFDDMARQIGQRWKALPEGEKKLLQDRATEEKNRYKTELEAWKAEQAVVKPTKSPGAAPKAETSDLDVSSRTNTNTTAEQDHASLPDPLTEERRLQELLSYKKQEYQMIGAELRDIQERRMAYMAGRMGTDSSMYQHYPSAAEASANALLSQYQPGSLGGMNPMGLMMGHMGTNARSMNNMGLNQMSMNNIGMNTMGMNTMGLNTMGMNAMGINNVGMNLGIGARSFAASMNMMTPSDLQQLAATRMHQQLLAWGDTIGPPRLRQQQQQHMTGEEQSRQGEMTSPQIRKNMNGRFER